MSLFTIFCLFTCGQMSDCLLVWVVEVKVICVFRLLFRDFWHWCPYKHTCRGVLLHKLPSFLQSVTHATHHFVFEENVTCITTAIISFLNRPSCPDLAACLVGAKEESWICDWLMDALTSELINIVSELDQGVMLLTLYRCILYWDHKKP